MSLKCTKNLKARLTPFSAGALLPVLAAVVVYYVAINNFFTWDDFCWLDKARSFGANPLQIFRPETANYFDPLVHAMFVVDFHVAGLNHHWYHAVDLATHAATALLVYFFARLLTGDDKTAIYSGIFFAASFAIADAVLWSSSRVDLVSTLFAVATMIQFLSYLRTGTRRYLIFSVILFIFSLAAKGTPIVLPLILFWLLMQEKKPLSQSSCLVPFIAIAAIYLTLLKLATYQPSVPLDGLHLNFHNLVIAFATSFVPEQAVSSLNPRFIAPVILILVSAVSLLVFRRSESVTSRRTGYCILMVALLPVLFTTDFKLMTKESKEYLLLSSPSHRIYLASVGTALLAGGVLRSLETFLKRFFTKIATASVVVLLGTVVAGDHLLVRERAKIWESVGQVYNWQVHGLLRYRGAVGEGSQIGLVSFTGARGFVLPLAKVCLNVDDTKILSPVVIGAITDMTVLDKAEKSHLFVYGRNGYVYDKTEQFRLQLQLNRMALLHPDHPEYMARCSEVARALCAEINQII